MKIKSNNILLFDGECNLCNGMVQFIINRDINAQIHFASLQSDIGKTIMIENNLPESYRGSIIFIEDEKVYTKSTAALRICLNLRAPWPIFFIFILIPSFLRDIAYDFVAKRRLKWFGKTNVCWVMKPEWKERFLV